MRKKAIVLGAGGFIGSHMVKQLKNEGYYVVGADLKYPEFSGTVADHFEIIDLRRTKYVDMLIEKKFWMDTPFDEIYQFAADMGGAGFVFTGENDADIMHNSAMINLNVAHAAVKYGIGKVFYSSSACVYPKENQTDPDNPNCEECSAYPANPDSPYGFEKLFSEKLYKSFERNYGLNIRIARYHNIMGPRGTWEGGREKAPAAMCRKVAQAKDGSYIEVWGKGDQTRSFLYINDCIEATRCLMESEYTEPINIGSEEMISINDLAQMTIDISGKELSIKNIPGPEGVRGRNSDNKLIRRVLGWEPKFTLRNSMELTYSWIEEQVEKRR